MSSPDPAGDVGAETSPDGPLGDPATDPTEPRSLSGIVIDERYEVGRVLGAGGMGAVYQGRQRRLDRPVAIKVMHPARSEDESSVKRFFVEAKATSAIQHPNIVEIIDFGQLPSGAPYIVMEHLDGRDLARLLRDEGPLSWSRTRVILLQVLAGLKAAHARGVLHRDIKPSNVFMVQVHEGGTEFAKLVDFGIAKFIDRKLGETSITEQDMVVGTSSYLAPELIEGVEPNPTTDVYAVGVLAFKMLTGRVPFEGSGFLQTLRRAAKDPLPDLRESCPEITAAAVDSIERALAKEPDDRYASVSEFQAALMSLDAAGRPRASGPTGTAVPVGRTTLQRRLVELESLHAKKPRRRLALVALVVAAAASFVVMGWVFARASERTREETVAEAGASVDEPAPNLVAPSVEQYAPPPAAATKPRSAPAKTPAPPPAQAETVQAEAEPPSAEPPAKSKPAPKSKKPKSTRSEPPGSKPSAAEPAPQTDADRVRALRRKVAKRCDLAGKRAVVKFPVFSSGKLGLVRVEIPGGDAAAEACIRKHVGAAKFPAGELRVLTFSLG